MTYLATFKRSVCLIILLGTIQPFTSFLTGADIDGFWRFTEESIQKIAKHIRETNSDKKDAEESIESYRNHVREFQVTGTGGIKIRLIQFKKRSDRYPEFIREYDLTYTKKEEGAFLISNGDKTIFSGQTSGETLYLDDVASGTRLELRKVTPGQLPYISDKTIVPSKLDKNPKARKLTEPVYPPKLKDQGITGIVELRRGNCRQPVTDSM